MVRIIRSTYLLHKFKFNVIVNFIVARLVVLLSFKQKVVSSIPLCFNVHYIYIVWLHNTSFLCISYHRQSFVHVNNIYHNRHILVSKRQQSNFGWSVSLKKNMCNILKLFLRTKCWTNFSSKIVWLKPNHYIL